MSDRSATVLEFPLDRRAVQIAAQPRDVDAELADVLRPSTLRVLPGSDDTNDGPRAA